MFKDITDDNFRVILKWRNLLENRQVMFTNHIISMQEHENWWQTVKNDTTKKTLMFSYNSVELGVVYFYDINKKQKILSWGFYLGQDEIFKESGINKIKAWIALEVEAINFATLEYPNFILFCEVFESNVVVNKMHKKNNFLNTDSYSKNINTKNENINIYQLKLSHNK